MAVVHKLFFAWSGNVIFLSKIVTNPMNIEAIGIC